MAILNAPKMCSAAQSGWQNSCTAPGLARVHGPSTPRHPIVYADFGRARRGKTDGVRHPMGITTCNRRSRYRTGNHRHFVGPYRRWGPARARARAMQQRPNLFIHLKALETLQKTRGRLPMNVKMSLRRRRGKSAAPISPHSCPPQSARAQSRCCRLVRYANAGA